MIEFVFVTQESFCELIITDSRVKIFNQFKKYFYEILFCTLSLFTHLRITYSLDFGIHKTNNKLKFIVLNNIIYFIVSLLRTLCYSLLKKFIQLIDFKWNNVLFVTTNLFNFINANIYPHTKNQSDMNSVFPIV